LAIAYPVETQEIWVQRGAETGPDVAEGDVDDADVDHRHQRPQHRGDGDEDLLALDGVFSSGERWGLVGADGDRGAHPFGGTAPGIPSRRISTGTRCTTFTKLPEALSGGEQREAGAGGAGHALHLALELLPAVGVDLHARRLAGLHPPDLVFLEVGHHPHVPERNDGHHRPLGGDQLTLLHGATAHHAVDGGADVGVAAVQRGEIVGGPGP
jgi:hypothetical protein